MSVLRKLMVGAAAAGITLVAGSGVALAAGSGYGAPPEVGTSTGAFYSVVSITDISGAAGGHATATIQGASVTLDVPPGELSGTVQAVFSSGDLAAIGTGGFGGRSVTAFGIQLDQNGHKLPGPFSPPLTVTVTVTVTDSAITSSSVVYLESGTSFVRAAGWTTSAGKATGTITTDPGFLVGTPAPAVTPVGVAIPGATTAVTGKPFFGEGLLAAALAAIGGFGAFRWRRQRRSVV